MRIASPVPSPKNCPPSEDPAQGSWDRMRAVGRGYVHFALAEPRMFMTTATRERSTTRGHGGGRGTSGLTVWELLEHALDDMLAAGAPDVNRDCPPSVSCPIDAAAPTEHIATASGTTG